MIDAFYVHTVTVQPWSGSGANGDVFGDPVQVTGFYDGGTKLVRGTDGEQVQSSATFYTSIDQQASFPIDSLVTFGTVIARVVQLEAHTSGALNLPDHIAVALV